MNKLEDLYQLIAQKLVGIIPDEWNKIFLYAEVLSDFRNVYFFYESSTLNKLVYSHDIPDEYDVSSEVYEELLHELREYFVDLQGEYNKISDQVWSNLTMYLDNEGEFNIDFGYDSSNGLAPDEQQAIWMFEVLGIYPSDEDYQMLIERQKKNKED